MTEDPRITDLEVKVAFQEKLLADLDDVVRAMRTELDELREEVDRLRDQVRPAAQETVDEKPPHY